MKLNIWIKGKEDSIDFTGDDVNKDYEKIRKAMKTGKGTYEISGTTFLISEIAVVGLDE